MTGQSGDWSRLARYVIDRRNELGLTQEDVRAAGGPSTATLRNIEGALQDSYKPGSLAKLERVLGWATGSVRKILDGQEPGIAHQGAARLEHMASRRAPGVAAPHPPDPLADLPDDPDERLAEIVRRANVLTEELAKLTGVRPESAEHRSRGKRTG
jgi:hypothetical protein